MVHNQTDPPIPNDGLEWYIFTLSCSHQVASKVRLRYRKPGVEHHRVHCPTCERTKKRKPHSMPTAWNLITEITNVPDVPSGVTPVVPARILRLDYPNAGGEIPYSSRERDY